MQAVPEVGSYKPVRTDMSVVFPAPVREKGEPHMCVDNFLDNFHH